MCPEYVFVLFVYWLSPCFTLEISNNTQRILKKSIKNLFLIFILKKEKIEKIYKP